MAGPRLDLHPHDLQSFRATVSFPCSVSADVLPHRVRSRAGREDVRGEAKPGVIDEMGMPSGYFSWQMTLAVLVRRAAIVTVPEVVQRPLPPTYTR
jgi:hypothetical protein